MNDKSVQKCSLKVIVGSLYVHIFCVFQKYKLLGDKPAYQTMAEPCLPISDLLVGVIRQKLYFIQTDPVK